MLIRSFLFLLTLVFVSISFCVSASQYTYSFYYEDAITANDFTTTESLPLLHLTASPGETLVLQFQIVHAVNPNYWASDGITFQLGNQKQQILAPKQPDWTNDIEVIHMAPTIQGDITIPSLGRGETQTVRGQIRGTLIYPVQDSDTYPYTYTDHQVNITQPVQVQLLAHLTFWWQNGRFLFYGIALLDALLLMVSPFTVSLTKNNLFNTHAAYFTCSTRLVFLFVALALLGFTLFETDWMFHQKPEILGMELLLLAVLIGSTIAWLKYEGRRSENVKEIV